jgi:hypothetical protein
VASRRPAPRPAPDPIPEAFAGSGRTTAQLRDAPPGALFVWCEDSVTYPRMLARQLGRFDIKVIGLSVFCDGGEAVRGMRCAVVVDHAARLNAVGLDLLDTCRWQPPAHGDAEIHVTD